MFRFECEHCGGEYGYLRDQIPTIHNLICPWCGEKIGFKRKKYPSEAVEDKPKRTNTTGGKQSATKSSKSKASSRVSKATSATRKSSRTSTRARSKS